MSNTAKINTVISADSSQFTKSINDAQKQVEAFSKHGLSEIGKEIIRSTGIENISLPNSSMPCVRIRSLASKRSKPF